MAHVVQVAEYILNQAGAMTAMKLEKIVYYSQAWHLAWTEKPLFDDKIEAWRDGPVVPKLFDLHKGQFKVMPGFFLKKFPELTQLSPLTSDEKDIISRVLGYYGDKDPHWLSQLTHLEDPWKKARDRSVAADHENSSEEITQASMFEYYSAL